MTLYRTAFRLFSGLGAVFAASAALAFDIGGQNARLETVVSGLDQPWGVAPLPGGGALVTERDGSLLFIDGGGKRQVSGVPAVVAQGQGGLLDVTLPRDFAQSREVFLTFSKRQGRGSGTALASGRLSADGARLENVKVLFESARGGATGRHFGSRVVEARDGTLFVTIGDRGDRPSAQDRRNHNGAIVRINRDGTVPSDNPFVGQSEIRPEIWSYGHRNPQGAGLDGRGTLWTAEHGARGGDEVNRIKKGAKFRLAGDLVWPALFGRQDWRGRVQGRDGTTGALLGPIDRPVWADGLSG